LDVVVKNKIDGKVSIPMTIIEENEGKFEIIAQDETSKILFLKIDEDDPPYKFPNDFSFEPRKETEEEMMVKPTCHGATMGTLEEAFNEKMLPGDISRKGIIVEERKRKNTIFLFLFISNVENQKGNVRS
jgi:hypothetical protein